ncbi:MAG: transposase [Alphaproteobacteria bacterium]
MARRQRRFWSDEEKRRIVAQARLPGVSVWQVARRYDVNANPGVQVAARSPLRAGRRGRQSVLSRSPAPVA